MAISPILLITFLLFLLTPITTPSNDDILSELIHLRSKSQLGLIHLKDPLLQRILTIPSPKPFSSLIFFDAKQLHSKPDNSLPSIKYEFSLLSSSFIKNNPENNTQVFFFIMEYQVSPSSFALFEVKSLPHIRLVGVKNESMKMDASGYSMGAESMKEFLEMHVNVNVGKINTPPVIPKKMMMVIGAGFLIWSPFLVKKIVLSDTLLHNKYVWMVGSVFVYFFSVAGTMHTIIRKAPLFLFDRYEPGKLIIFYQGSGMQLGAEGFAIGFLYTIVGLLLALMTHVLVYMKNRGTQNLMMAFGLFISFWAVQKVVSLDNWKTGYGIHAYWPSRWI
ncbi:probable dolichyl-diphosphooligosaccharide--protein glycosyltransferase subunit 3B [Lycium ferocissimum]|uniref:probable dolichyl-diphosphooligosaccharide--protein glycosyltransferase subunit 3B n=1 Tax=Lycium ferocissimum TaxID=112874 RepID=UPI002814BB27|nr:probable dolichyl-diphosphooligosaccharide--protein glycosyltransferase subunit 3B [Lycium ferocissimum]